MKPSHWIATALLAAATLTTPRLARAEDADLQELRSAVYQLADAIGHYRRDDAVKDSKDCVAAYDKLHAAGAADTRTIEVFNPIADQKHGDKVTIKQMRDACVVAAASLVKEELLHDLGNAAGGVFAAMGDRNASATRLTDEAHLCSAAVKAALAGGIDPSEKLESSSWTGPVGAVQAQVCDQATAAADKKVDEMMAPYKAAGIQGDKLAMLKENGGSTLYQIPGGESTLDPQKLAKASVWFEFFEGDECARGKIETMHRYQFDKNGKLVKNTVREFCGDPPKSAYK